MASPSALPAEPQGSERPPVAASPLSALHERVSLAAAALAERERDALVLRERDGRAYADIARRIDVPADEVAELLLAARLGVREAVRGSGVPAPSGEECETARILLTARLDGELTDTRQAGRLREHMAACDECPEIRLALREAGLACRGAFRFAPELASAGSDGDEALAAAAATDDTASEVGEETAARPAPASDETPSGRGQLAGPAFARDAVAPRNGRPVAPRRVPTSRPTGRPQPRSRVARRLAVVLLLLAAAAAAAAALAGLAGGGGAAPVSAPREAPERPAGRSQPAAGPSRPAERPRRRGGERRERSRRTRRGAAPVATATPAATAEPATTATPSPTPSPTREAREDRRRSDDRAGGGTRTEVRSNLRRGAGLPAPGATPAPTAPAPGEPGGGPVDGCTEELPDCESG